MPMDSAFDFGQRRRRLVTHEARVRTEWTLSDFGTVDGQVIDCFLETFGLHASFTARVMHA